VKSLFIVYGPLATTALAWRLAYGPRRHKGASRAKKKPEGTPAGEVPPA